MSYTDYLASRGYKRVTVERTTLCGAPAGHRIIDRVDQPARLSTVIVDRPMGRGR